MPSITSSEIFEAINIACDEGQLMAIKGLLTKNHDAILDLLGISLTPEAVQYVAQYNSAGNPKVLLTFICILERDIERFLLNQKSPEKPTESLEETLKNALQNKRVSAELLETVSQYIEAFCAKYPPQKIVGQNKEVEEKEINTLQQCMRAIKQCIEDVRLIALLHHIKPETRRLHISKRKNIIDSLAHIMVYLRHITDRSDTHTPYNELCKPGQPFGPDRHGFSCRQLIYLWEGLQCALNKLRNSENI